MFVVIITNHLTHNDLQIVGDAASISAAEKIAIKRLEKLAKDNKREELEISLPEDSIDLADHLESDDHFISAYDAAAYKRYKKLSDPFIYVVSTGSGDSWSIWIKAI